MVLTIFEVANFDEIKDDVNRCDAMLWVDNEKWQFP